MDNYRQYKPEHITGVEGEYVLETKWLLCPACGSKTRIKVRTDTELRNFPLFCPKCKQETLINVQQLNISVIKEPDAKTQSR
jgi:Zn finger protein HypA/HybF involved in hydrogenase expression